MRHGGAPVLHGSPEHAPIPVFTPDAPILALKQRGAWSLVRPHGYGASSGVEDASIRRWCGMGGTWERLRSAVSGHRIDVDDSFRRLTERRSARGLSPSPRTCEPGLGLYRSAMAAARQGSPRSVSRRTVLDGAIR